MLTSILVLRVQCDSLQLLHFSLFANIELRDLRTTIDNVPSYLIA